MSDNTPDPISDEDAIMEDAPLVEPDDSADEDYQSEATRQLDDTQSVDRIALDSDNDDQSSDGYQSEVPIQYINKFPTPKFSIEVLVPTLAELDAAPSDYLIPSPAPVPRVSRVLKELRKNGSLHYRVQLSDGSIQELSFMGLVKAQNGTSALNKYTSGPGAGQEPEDAGSSGDDVRSSARRSSSINTDRNSRRRNLEALRRRQLSRQATEDGEEEELESSGELRPTRRSTRSKGKIGNFAMLSYGDGFDSDDDLVGSDLHPNKKTRPQRKSVLATARRRRHDSSDETSDQEMSKRRSGRSKRQKQSYADVDIDVELVRSESESKPSKLRMIHSKEVYPLLDSDNEFVRAHNETCDACGGTGPSTERGRLVYCQGCSMSYHKVCIGHRSAREHLVTKVSPVNFVLQCRRCIGRAKMKDASLPSLNRCTDCESTGRSCEPFKSLKKQKDANRGERELTPETEVPEHLLYASKNVLFRCTGCFRAWHFNHLPDRGTKASGSNLWETRMLQYTTDFKCQLCEIMDTKISNIVAWRPLDPEARKEPATIEEFSEDEREYLVRFENQSYFKAQWVPGPWVVGRAPFSRTAFVKKRFPPKMTTEEAIDEEWLRIDICLDVEYTSYIPLGKDVEIDLKRISEVSQAYVKYRGLGYEDAVWEEPPKESDKERWDFWVKAYEDYIHGFYVRLPKNIAKKVEKAKAESFPNLELKQQPAYIKGGTLMQYQIEGFNWLYYRWHKSQNVVLADEMGLGKTIQIVSFLAVLFEEQQVWPFLVVAPHSTVPNWKREFQTWAPSLRVVAYNGLDVARKLIRKYEMMNSDTGELKCHVVICSYSQPTNAEDSKFLRRIPWEVMVVDEGQRLKNDASIMYKELEKFKIRQKVLLTGTPLQNNIRELFNLLQFLDPQNVKAQELEEEYEDLNTEKVNEIHNMLRPSFLRRTKAEVLTHIIPPMAEIIVPVSMTTLQRKLYKSVLSKDPNLIKSILYRGEAKQKERAKLNNLLMQLRKCVCHPFLYSQDVEERLDDPILVHQNLVEAGSKLKLLSIMLPKLQSQGHRVLLFSQFLGMLDIVEDFLEGIGMKYQRLDGSTSTLQKQKCIDAFNAPNSEYFAFLLSTRAGGVGINLATADTVIILDPDFNPHQDIQALSRAHRIGQKNKVLCMRLVTRDTVEQKILDIGKKKRTMDHVIVERMGNEDEEEVVDVESILRFGVESLFSDDAEDRAIVYDDANVEKLLDREHITNTIQGNDGPTSAESNSFGFARVWQNDTGTFEAHNPEESADETHSPEPGFWEKVLRQREEEARREEAARQAELAKGRRRKVINYAAFDRDDKGENISDGSDTDFREEPGADADSDGDSDHGHMADLFMDMDIRTLENAEERARLTGLLRNTPQHKQFQMAAADFQNPMPSTGSSNMALPAPFSGMPLGLAAPTGHESAIPAPRYRPDGIPQPGDPDYDPGDWIHTRVVPPVLVDGLPHLPRCPACGSRHEGGARLCPLRLAGVERCPFCNIAHLGDPKSCPHLKSETQIRRLLEALDKSSEPKDIVDFARKFCVDRLAAIRRGKKKKSEAAKKEVEEMAKAQVATAIHNRA